MRDRAPHHIGGGVVDLALGLDPQSVLPRLCVAPKPLPRRLVRSYCALPGDVQSRSWRCMWLVRLRAAQRHTDRRSIVRKRTYEATGDQTGGASRATWLSPAGWVKRSNGTVIPSGPESLRRYLVTSWSPSKVASA
jgi:hypothetical protein